METKNNNVVNLLVFNKETGSIGVDSQLFGLLSQLIISERNDAAERRKEYSRQQAAREQVDMELQKLRIKREELELEKAKFQLEKDKFRWDLEKTELLSKKKGEKEYK